MIQRASILSEAVRIANNDIWKPTLPARVFPVGFKLYLAGPMSGIADHNFPAFRAKAQELRDLGFHVVNPAELHGDDRSQRWSWYLKRDIRALVECDGIYMMEGWTNSKGASFEFDVAQTLEMEVMYYDQLVKTAKV